MRFERLFADLDAQFAAMDDAEMRAELADQERVAIGSVTLAQRCRGNLGRQVRVCVAGMQTIAGELTDIGPDWLLIAGRGTGSTLIPDRAVAAIEGLSRATGVPLGDGARRFDLRLALRSIARDRSTVQITVAGMTDRGTARQYSGTIDRIGADFLELAAHPAWELRGDGPQRTAVAIALGGICAVHAHVVG